MDIDKRVVAMILVLGIFASMVTIAFYSNLHGPALPKVSTSHQTSGLIILEVTQGDDQTNTGEVATSEILTESTPK